MSFTITENFVKSFANNVYMRAAEITSKFESAVRVETGIVGRMKSIDRLDSGEAVQDTTRHGDTPLHDLEHDRRWLPVTDWIFSPMIDDEDKLKMLIDFTSPYVERSAQAMNRVKDDRVIAAATGSVITGENFDGTATFPAGQQIAAGGVGLDLAKLRSTMQLLARANVLMDEEFYMAVDPRQIYTDLLALTEIGSSDYNTVKALVDGKVGSYMGFKFIVSNRLSATAASGGVRSVLAWAKSGLVLGIAKDKSIEVVRRADKKNNAQIIAKMSVGAVRAEDVKVVEVLCQE